MAVNGGTIEIPKTYKAVEYDKPGSISTKLVERETPEPGAGQVLVRLYVFSCPDMLINAEIVQNTFRVCNRVLFDAGMRDGSIYVA